MKKVEAYIRKSRLAAVQGALDQRGLKGMTVLHAHGRGEHPRQLTVYRGASWEFPYLRCVKLELLVNDESLDDAIDAIYENAYTGDAGDGKIMVTNLEYAICIRTGKSDVGVREHRLTTR